MSESTETGPSDAKDPSAKDVKEEMEGAKKDAPSEDKSEKRVIRCSSCGGTRMEKTPSYGFIGWVLLLFGASVDPDGIELHCKRCGKLVEVDDQDEE